MAMTGRRCAVVASSSGFWYIDRHGFTALLRRFPCSDDRRLPFTVYCADGTLVGRRSGQARLTESRAEKRCGCWTLLRHHRALTILQTATRAVAAATCVVVARLLDIMMVRADGYLISIVIAANTAVMDADSADEN